MQLSGMKSHSGRNPKQIGQVQRDQLAAYFLSNAGSVPQQDRITVAALSAQGHLCDWINNM